MKKIKIIYAWFVLLLILAYGCKPQKQTAISCVRNNAGIITGSVSYTNYYTRNRSLLADVTVYMNSNGYVRTTQTDSAGNYIFYGVDTCDQYTVYAYDNITAPPPFTMPYYGEATGIKPGAGNTVININETIWDSVRNGVGYRGMSITTADEGAGRIGNVVVYLYGSAALALADSNLTGSLGSYTHFVTDSNGRWLLVFPTYTPSDTILYANASFTDSANNKFGLRNHKISLEAGFTNTTLILRAQ